MSSLLILAALVLRYRAEKKTQTNRGENPTPATAVGVSNKSA